MRYDLCNDALLYSSSSDFVPTCITLLSWVSTTQNFVRSCECRHLLPHCQSAISQGWITFMMAHMQPDEANATPQSILNRTPFPTASIKGFPMIAPIAARIFRIRLFIATADELRPGTASMRYVVTVENTSIIPKPKKKLPISGIMTNSPFWTVQPYRRRPSGYIMAPVHVLSPNRPSASSRPPCLAADLTKI